MPVATASVIAAIGLWTLSLLHPGTPYSDIWWRQVIAGRPLITAAPTK